MGLRTSLTWNDFNLKGYIFAHRFEAMFDLLVAKKDQLKAIFVTFLL
jgi:hypothetical protein